MIKQKKKINSNQSSIEIEIQFTAKKLIQVKIQCRKAIQFQHSIAKIDFN